MEPPVHIPNTEVKRLSADDTRGATLWENMPLPEVFKNLVEQGSLQCIEFHKCFDLAGWMSHNLNGWG